MKPTGYGTPVVETNASGSQVVVNTQKLPVVVVGTAVNPDMLKSSPVPLQCPFCLNMVTTNTVEKWNCPACCLCFWTGFVVYACIQCCRGKDLCCYDVYHTCPKCGNNLGTYKAC